MTTPLDVLKMAREIVAAQQVFESDAEWVLKGRCDKDDDMQIAIAAIMAERERLGSAASDVIAERQRQISKEC